MRFSKINGNGLSKATWAPQDVFSQRNYVYCKALGSGLRMAVTYIHAALPEFSETGIRVSCYTSIHE